MSELALAWPMVVGFMRKRCGLVLRDDQQYLLDARLGSVIDRLGYSSILRFVADATAPTATQRAVDLLIDAMTTHETSFFRDAGFWSAFVRQVVPALRASARERRPRIWSAACSTGQEPYTLAMVLAEEAPDLAGQIDIVATDVSEPALERARQGLYTPFEVNRGLGAERVARHLKEVAGGYQVRPELRARVEWEVHNLLGARPGPGGCDVVLCRNVLFYFDDSDRLRVIDEVRGAARPGGWLGVGATESLPGASVSPGWYRKA